MSEPIIRKWYYTLAITEVPTVKCIFCKHDSTASKSREHIVPESLGNTKNVLPPGVVCDACNNYFARKVEQAVLNSFSRLRSFERIVSKKGRIPMLEGIMSVGLPGKFYWPADANNTGAFIIDDQINPDESKAKLEKFFAGNKNMILTPSPEPEFDDKIFSRFLAKIAIEAMAQKIMSIDGWNEYIINERSFDPLRNYARYGAKTPWPFHARQLYERDAQRTAPNGEQGQMVYEYNFFQTRHGEVYFVIILFGSEFTINVGGREIDGYKMWLEENKGKSPLYLDD